MHKRWSVSCGRVQQSGPEREGVCLQAPKACMGPGTGLGQANLYWSENFGSYRVWPSEGAHASFAPRGWKQRALQTHVERQLGYCEIEHVRPFARKPGCLLSNRQLLGTVYSASGQP